MSNPAAVPRPVGNDKQQGKTRSLLSRERFLGFLNIAETKHFFKIRDRWQASKSLYLEAGLDLDLQSQKASPYLGAKLLFDAEKPEGWALEYNTDWAVIQTPTVELIPFTSKVSLPVNARIGTDFYNNNQPHVEVGIKNKYVVIGILAASLALKKPLKIHVKRKEVGGFDWSIPLAGKEEQNGNRSYKAEQKVEIDGSIRREGPRILVDLAQLNPVLRLQQQQKKAACCSS